MARKIVATQLVERAGFDVAKLIGLPARNAAAELTTCHYHTTLCVDPAGLESEGLKQTAKDARIEDRNHFEALVPRSHELGGELPDAMVEFHDIAACPPASLPAGPTDTMMPQVLLAAGQ